MISFLNDELLYLTHLSFLLPSNSLPCNYKKFKKNFFQHFILSHRFQLFYSNPMLMRLTPCLLSCYTRPLIIWYLSKSLTVPPLILKSQKKKKWIICKYLKVLSFPLYSSVSVLITVCPVFGKKQFLSIGSQPPLIKYGTMGVTHCPSRFLLYEWHVYLCQHHT